MQGISQFKYVKGVLSAEGVPVVDLANEYGTPLYVYSRSHLVGQYRALKKAMAGVSPLICYSMKANSNGVIIGTFVKEGAGVDIVSAGELYRALRAGASPSKIVFAGVGKTRTEIEYALRSNVLFFTVESEPEAMLISACATALGRVGRIAFRVNPDVDPKTHKYISTGKRENKFGLDLRRVMGAYEMASRLPGIEIAGIHVHIGSQILDTGPFVQALKKINRLCRELVRLYPSIRYLDIGGGIGIKYRPDQQPLLPGAFAKAIMPELKRSGLKIVMEPGRFMVGNAGILICTVLYVKDHPLGKFVITDAGMNDLIRPSLYDAYHEILPARKTRGTITGDVVGPICESGDFIAKGRTLPAVNSGDVLAVMSAGAYGFAMASTYNSRPRPPEVMVDGRMHYIIRQRETFDHLVLREVPATYRGRAAGGRKARRNRK